MTNTTGRKGFFFEKMNFNEMMELFAMDNVILSPHIAGWTVESKEKLAIVIGEKIIQNFKKSSK